MQNILPKKTILLAAKAGEMAQGSAQYGGSIPLAVVTHASLLAKITPIMDAILAGEQAKKEVATKQKAVAALIGPIRVFLANMRDHCKSTLGPEHNAGWDVTGFVGSIAVPRGELNVVALLHLVKGFLASNAAFELESKGITAAAAQALLTQIEAARGAVALQKKLARDMVSDRNTQATALRKAMRDMINELKSRLTPMDSRWVAFKLNLPGALATPDVPSNVTVVLVGPTAASVKWDPSARATYYRVWMRIGGETQPWTPLGSRSDLDLTMEQLPSNSTIEVAVSAVNSGGESQKSEPVTITTPA